MKEHLTAKQLMNRYAEMGVESVGLARALRANYASAAQIQRFELAADRCETLNHLYCTVQRREGRFNNL